MTEGVDSALVLARISAHVLNLLVNELGLGQLAERYAGDNIDQWQVVSPLLVKALLHSKCVAEITYSYNDDSPLPSIADIVVRDAYLMIRGQHIAEFDPAAHGITINNRRDWRDEKYPDIDVSFRLEDVASEISGLDLPRRPIPRKQNSRKVKVIGSLRRRR